MDTKYPIKKTKIGCNELASSADEVFLFGMVEIAQTEREGERERERERERSSGGSLIPHRQQNRR